MDRKCVNTAVVPSGPLTACTAALRWTFPGHQSISNPTRHLQDHLACVRQPGRPRRDPRHLPALASARTSRTPTLVNVAEPGRSVGRAALAVATAAVLVGCASEPSSEAAGSTAPSASPSGVACPEPASAPAAFPAGLPADFPADFPAPPGAGDAVADDADPAVVAVRFPSSAPLRESVQFVLDRLPAAGFQITGGDQEPHEADVVFAQGALRGQLRIARVDDCTTFWLVQVVRPTG